MQLRLLHIHFVDGHDCVHVSLTSDLKHTIYKNPKNNRKVTIPKMDGEGEEVDPFVIDIACTYLCIPTPNVVLERIAEFKRKITQEGSQQEEE